MVAERHTYSGDKTPNEDPVFVACNFFSLLADKVIYDAKTQVLEAIGNVIIEEESGSSLSADSAFFEIVDGQAVRLR